MIQKNLVVAVVAILFFSTISFYGGMKYQQSRLFSQRRDGALAGQFGRGGQMGNQASGLPNGSRRGGQMVTGEVISVDDKSVTVKLADGGSKVALISSSTLINKSATAQLADLKSGERVAIFGSQNSDGSLSAQSLQLNPQLPSPTK